MEFSQKLTRKYIGRHISFEVHSVILRSNSKNIPGYKILCKIFQYFKGQVYIWPLRSSRQRVYISSSVNEKLE